ncbi:hypothetical protein [Hymenobacter weizhouensis]|uniref:hypothetical protein n=1 Tax=Hymenobacter sp. YIM 151500-1 TaxID=2987689 RepID=UPI002226B9DE|nr:hypothetical protein [Hymenobacter sp. YIM 151500-1]UYZ61898.1 hypothetical protein OIS53_12905 [Hymenobacter sp. YIM 151500-1]
MEEIALQVVAFLAGVFLVIVTLSAAIRSFVLPRNESVLLNAWVFQGIRFFFDLAAGLSRTYSRRDKIEAHYAPVALVTLPIIWLTVVTAGFTLIYWGLGERDWLDCFQLSGSSLLTLGTHKTRGAVVTVFTFAEATMGLLLMTLLISYLPTIYQAFSRRELVVARLELRAGAPTSACTLLTWLNRSGSLLDDDEQWERWEEWFMEIEESHTSLPIISFFRSPQPGRSWVTAAGLILDTAALMFSVAEGPRSRQAELTFKAGCIALNRVYRFFDERGRTGPTSLIEDNDPIEDPERADFDHVCEELQANGFQLRPNRDEAWQQYHTLRSRYREALDFLARLTVAPELKAVR